MVIAKFSSLIDYVRALTGMLGLYHTLVIKKCHLELIGGNGEKLCMSKMIERMVL